MEDQLEALRAQIKTEMDSRKAMTNEATTDPVVTEAAPVDTAVAEFTTTDEGHAPAASDVDPFLEQAIKEGFDPNYKGPNKKTPEQFVKDGSFFRKIDSLNKKIDELADFNRQTLEHNKKLEKASYEKALRDLQMQKLDAIRNGDVDNVLTIEKQAEAMQAHINQQATPAPAAPDLSKEVVDFRTKHQDWITGTSAEDKRMQVMTQKIIEFLNETSPGISEAEGIKEIEKRLKVEFPSRFSNPNQSNASLTAESTTSKNKEQDYTGLLSDRQKEFYKNAKKYGSKLTLKEYVNQLRLTGDLNE